MNVSESLDWLLKNTNCGNLEIVQEYYNKIANSLIEKQGKNIMSDKYGYPDDSRVCYSIRPIIDRVINNAPAGAIFVESGCYLGNTTKHFIEKLLAAGKPFQYFAIDNWKLDNVTERHDDNLQFFKDNLGDLAKHVNVICSDALAAVSFFQDDSVYFAFLDDSHVYSHVVKQIPLWIPKMKDESILAGDDYYCDDVKRAVAEHFDIKDVELLYGENGFSVGNPKSKQRKNK